MKIQFRFEQRKLAVCRTQLVVRRSGFICDILVTDEIKISRKALKRLSVSSLRINQCRNPPTPSCRAASILASVGGPQADLVLDGNPLSHAVT